MQKQKPQTVRKKLAVRKKPAHVSITRRVVRFMPALVLFGLSGLVSVTHATTSRPVSVLGYATSVNPSDLLSSTNAQRTGGSVGNLALNGQLMSAAQAKADDMVARDYWSHTTPDGEEPWAFMTRAGYTYKAAGENLAYGFATSSDTVTGWMNSPPHRQNLMNAIFLDVGFGIANSANFVGSGQQTIVVAMYGAQAGSSSPAAPAASAPTAPPATKSAVSQPAAQPIDTVAEPVETPAPATEDAPIPAAEPVNLSDTSTISEAQALVATPAKVRRIQVLTAGNAQWSGTLLVAGICAIGLLWAFQRGSQIRRLALMGEHFFFRHAHIDLAFLGFLTLGWTLLQTSGVIR